VLDEESPLEKLKTFVAQSAAALVGIVLMAIGVSGRLGLPLYPVEDISFLMQPMPLGDAVNGYYWLLLALVGFWLILFVYPRLASAVAIALIAFKWAALQGYFVTFS